MHMFWDYRRSKEACEWVLSFFASYTTDTISWVHALLGDLVHMKISLFDVWHIFRIGLMFHIWKTHNKIMFQKHQGSNFFTLADKIKIFLDMWF